MKYDSATIDVQYEEREPATVELDGMDSLSALDDHLHGLFSLGDDDQTTGLHLDCKLTNPQGFAVHLFPKKRGTQGAELEASSNFDDLLSTWSNETDSDRREAMGEYLDDMGADDLSDFDEAYLGQYSSEADFAQRFSEETGSIPDNIPSWIAIDWQQTWERSLRHDYHITDSGHVFRNL